MTAELRSKPRATERPAPLRHRLAGGLAEGAAAALRRSPAWLAYGLADAASLGVIAFALVHELRVAPRGRGLLRNQRIVYRGAWTRRLAARLLFAWARHMTHLAVDFCRMPRIVPENVERHVDARGIAPLRELAERGEPLILVSGHIGVWELCGHAWRSLGHPITIVARPIPVGPLHRVVGAIRTSGGQRVLDKRGVLWTLKKALDRGEVVGLLADEDAPEAPVFAPYLGTRAATSPAPAFLHLVTGAPLAVATCHRVGRERFRLDLWALIRHTPSGDRDADIRSITLRINDALSRAIRARPEQWLWGARRFRTRPPGEVPGPDGLPPPAASGLRLTARSAAPRRRS